MKLTTEEKLRVCAERLGQQAARLRSLEFSVGQKLWGGAQQFRRIKSVIQEVLQDLPNEEEILGSGEPTLPNPHWPLIEELLPKSARLRVEEKLDTDGDSGLSIYVDNEHKATLWKSNSQEVAQVKIICVLRDFEKRNGAWVEDPRKRQLEEFHALEYATPMVELVEICREVIETDTAAKLTPEVAQRILALTDLAGLK